MKKKEKEKRKHFSLPTSRRKLTGNSFFVSFIRFFPFSSHSIRIHKGSIRYAICFFGKEKRKYLLLVRRLDHQTIESFVFFFCLLSFFCAHSNSFRGFMYIGMYM